MFKILKIIISIILLSTSIYSQLLSGYKFCIDPGHGGHDAANDRFIPQTGLWESESNFDKALHAKEIFESLGATVILTRFGNSDADDIPLSQRAAIANANNVDFFNSIHSNGFQGTANSTLVLFRGYDGAPVFPDAKIMGSILVQRIYEVNRTTGTSNRGDWSFYPDWGTSGLGVLRPLNMPGTLTEGSFHDYIPESWRLLNTNYRRHEAWAIARGFIDFYSAGALSFGAVAGILRDPDVNVSYYYIPSLNDQKKPINYVNVTIEPGNLVYEGDDLNNGFYLFDSLAPGQYKVFLTAEDYKLDSTNVTVIADRTVFADKFLQLEPNLNVPQVVEFSPAADASGLSLQSNLEMSFDIRMNPAKVQSALSFSPQTTGTFTWSNNNKTFVFKPSNLLQPGIEYTVTLSATAESFFGVPIQTEFSFNFTTRSKLTLVGNYPDFSDSDISTTVKIVLEFDAPIDQSTLPGNINLVNNDNQNISVIVSAQSYSDGKIIFEPRDPLVPNSTYTIKLKQGIGDIENLKLDEDIDINFVTDAEVYVSGNIVDGFEDISNWQQPSLSSGSSNINESATMFEVSNQKKISGQTSGKLSYEFTAAEGTCMLNTNINFGAIPDSRIGLWVFGDLSYNSISFLFSDTQSNTASVEVDTINFTGWKILDVNSQQLALSGDITLDGIKINKLSEGNEIGAIYLDDLQSDVITPVEDSEIEEITSYGLAQNYPNPFNPTTKITFTLADAEIVTITIYDILGGEVDKLVNNKEFDKGKWSVIWEGKNRQGNLLPSGIYLYKIKAGGFSFSRKMILLK